MTVESWMYGNPELIADRLREKTKKDDARKERERIKKSRRHQRQVQQAKQGRR
jgi:hypothetical protein